MVARTDRFDALGEHLTHIQQIEEHIADARLQRAVRADIKQLERRRDAEQAAHRDAAPWNSKPAATA